MYSVFRAQRSSHQYRFPPHLGSRAITISRSTASSRLTRSRTSTVSIPTGMRRFGLHEFRRSKASSEATASRFSALGSRAWAPRRMELSLASRTKQSSNSTCLGWASTRGRRRFGYATHTPAGGHSSPDRQTACSWMETSSQTRSIIGGRQAWCSCAIRSFGGLSGIGTGGKQRSRSSIPVTTSTQAISA